MYDEKDSNRHEKRYGLIVDGVHTCPEAVKLAYRTSPKRLVTVDDVTIKSGQLVIIS